MPIELSTQSEAFQRADEASKMEMIQSDAFRLAQQYVFGQMEYEAFKTQIEELSQFTFLDKAQFKENVRRFVLYEAYQYSFGKENLLRSQIRERVLRYTEGK
ncbi:MAG: hypothetical protein AAF990_01755 [Bacteroidota bacterium]